MAQYDTEKQKKNKKKHNYDITMISHEHHTISNHQQPNCLPRLTTKKWSELHITGPLQGKSTRDRRISLTKGQ